MNRRDRRKEAAESRLTWSKVTPRCDFDALGDCDGRNLLMSVFRSIPGQSSEAIFDDRTLFNATIELIKHGFLEVWFAFDGKDIRVKTRIMTPADLVSGGAA